MRIFRAIAYTVSAMVLAGGWAFLYLQSRTIDLTVASGALATLRELREFDARWNDRLIRTHALAPDQPVSRRDSFATLHARLEQQALGLGGAHLGQELSALKQAFAEKAASIAQHAAARASLSAATEETRLQAAQEEDRLFQQAFFASTGPRLDLLHRSIERTFDSLADEAERYRVLLLFYSLFLLTMLLYLAYRVYESSAVIRRVNQQLQEANEGLERRVAERTSELSGALAKLKESEVMLIQSEKLSSLGQMVAGIAHEVNTPLAYVKSSLEAVRGGLVDTARLAAEVDKLTALLAAETPDDTQLAAQFGVVQELVSGLQRDGGLAVLDTLIKDGLYGITQISDIVTSLKDFSRLDRAKVADFDLNEGIESAITIGRNQLKHRTVKKLFGQIPKVSCSPSQINQVFLNLLTNAAQATPESGGTITVRTLLRDAGHVAVEVIDNGHGIPPEVQGKIFDPFFTTKAVGEGTGLGLSISYKIIASHGGRIEVASEVGKGTRFTVVLPLKAPVA